MPKIFLSIVLCLGVCLGVAAQSVSGDSCVVVSSEEPLPEITFGRLIGPASLMSWGVIEVTLANKYRLLNYGFSHEVAEHQPPKLRFDDVTQYVPAASVYALNWAGVRGRHDFWDRTAILALSSAFVAVTVNSIKYTVREQRPDKSERNSFPSGHTTVAFMGAEFLWREYKDVSPWYGVCGYAVAIATGAGRVYNNRHWAGDVCFGAGLGILCTRSAYWLYPRLKRHFRRNAPQVRFEGNVVALSVSF